MFVDGLIEMSCHHVRRFLLPDVSLTAPGARPLENDVNVDGSLRRGLASRVAHFDDHNFTANFIIVFETFTKLFNRTMIGNECCDRQ